MDIPLENLQILQKSINKLKKQNEKLKKDLKILKILKKYSYSHDDNTLFIALDCMKFDELKKIKEWLENEN